MNVSDWRRDNVNRLIKRIYQGVHSVKRTVQFGVSPFGIWQPGFPPSVSGLNSYEALYADSRLWLATGIVDYLAPQVRAHCNTGIDFLRLAGSAFSFVIICCYSVGAGVCLSWALLSSPSLLPLSPLLPLLNSSTGKSAA